MTDQELTSNFHAYQRAKHEYLTAKANGDWADALDAIRSAIKVCPIEEALPALTASREEASQRVRDMDRGFLSFLGIRRKLV